MKKHTLAGDEIVAELNFAWDIRPMVRNHHEHWDGTGYPDRLRGDAIPLTARILCIADVYDALTTTRSYREAYTPAAALEIMKKEAGTVLDPNLFAIFEKQIWPTLEG
jgi:HD-GYP domain-containing protein (c-di-GMP phosphodiesterase class II)